MGWMENKYSIAQIGLVLSFIINHVIFVLSMPIHVYIYIFNLCCMFPLNSLLIYQTLQYCSLIPLFVTTTTHNTHPHKSRGLSNHWAYITVTPISSFYDGLKGENLDFTGFM